MNAQFPTVAARSSVPFHMHTLEPIPRTVRWSLDPQISPVATVDTSCSYCTDCSAIIHDLGPDGFCACGCRHVRGELVEVTEQVRTLELLNNPEYAETGCSDCP